MSVSSIGPDRNPPPFSLAERDGGALTFLCDKIKELAAGILIAVGVLSVVGIPVVYYFCRSSEPQSNQSKVPAPGRNSNNPPHQENLNHQNPTPVPSSPVSSSPEISPQQVRNEVSTSQSEQSQNSTRSQSTSISDNQAEPMPSPTTDVEQENTMNSVPMPEVQPQRLAPVQPNSQDHQIQEGKMSRVKKDLSKFLADYIQNVRNRISEKGYISRELREKMNNDLDEKLIEYFKKEGIPNYNDGMDHFGFIPIKKLGLLLDLKKEIEKQENHGKSAYELSCENSIDSILTAYGYPMTDFVSVLEEHLSYDKEKLTIFADEFIRKFSALFPA